jgi:hypothetical protein
MSRGWIGVDLDGVLAHYLIWEEDGGIGRPVPAMVDRVKEWLAAGEDVRIFTARVTVEDITENVRQRKLINDWCFTHLGKMLPITATKDMRMRVLYDDRCVQVVSNTGQLLGYEKEPPPTKVGET